MWNHVASFGLTNERHTERRRGGQRVPGRVEAKGVGQGRIIGEVTEGGAADRRKEKLVWEWLCVGVWAQS